MKKQFFPTLLICLGCILFVSTSFVENSTAPPQEYYQLSIYHFKNAGQFATTSNYLKSTYLPALHKQGLTNIGVFSSIDNDTATDKKMYVLIPFASLQKFEALMNVLSARKLTGNDTSAYSTAAYNNTPFDRVEIILLKAFRDMAHLKKPALTAPLSDRVYELRSYEGPTETLYRQKVKMFNDGGEVKLFDRLNFNAVFYAEALTGSRTPNLIYMTTFNNKAERDEHWKNFGSDSTWKRISAMPEYLNTVSKSDILFLRPTDYSDY